MGKRRFTIMLAMAALVLVLAAPALAAERVALVVGNAAYEQEIAALKNPVNDAAAVSAALRRLGFEVIEGRDLDEEDFYDKIIAFDDAARSARMTLFFYAGHGLQVDGRNYLAPVDLKLERKQDLKRGAVELADVLEVMRSETNLVILDACRNNPLAGKLARALGMNRAAVATRGLARVESARGTLIAYATEPGAVAADGTGDHSPFTAALLEHLETPGLSVQDLFTQVTASVLQRTGEKQKPWTHSSLSKIVRLVPGDDPEPTVEAPTEREPVSERLTAAELAAQRLAAERELLFWESVKDSTDPADVQAYLDRYPNGVYAVLARNRLKRLPNAVAPAASQAPSEPSPTVPDPESVEAGLELSRKDRRVIQLGLAAEGFDPGPADGLFGRGTRGAIRQWQGSRGEEVTGHLDVESAKLLLASGRQHEQEAAPRAVEEAERQRREQEARERARPEQEVARQAAAEAERQRREQETHEQAWRKSEETFGKALSAAQRIEDDALRVYAFVAIAQARAQAGNIQDAEESLSRALATAQRIKNDWRASAFAQIAQAQAQAGNIRDASATAQRIEGDDFQRAFTFAQIAQAQAQAGNIRDAEESFSKALAIAQRIEGDDFRRASVFAQIARAQAQAGNIRDAEGSFSKAWASVQRIEHDSDRVLAFSAIAQAQAQAGNIRDALATAQRIEGDDTADSIRASVFAQIAQVLAQAGNIRDAEESISKALAAAQRIRNDSWRAGNFASIAQAQAQAGNIRDALATAQRIEGDDFYRATVFAEIAQRQVQAGNIRGAEESLSKAWTSAKRLEDDYYRTFAFVSIAQVQAAMASTQAN